MDQKWRILLYETISGDSPVKNFINSLDEKAQAKIYGIIELLKLSGTSLGGPHLKKLAGTSFWEIRILGSDSIRILYIAVEIKTFILLHGFKKKKQKTDQKEIKIATDRLNEYKSRRI